MVELLQEKICGKCSQKQGMALADRIQIALSREYEVFYFCTFCNIEHKLVRSSSFNISVGIQIGQMEFIF